MVVGAITIVGGMIVTERSSRHVPVPGLDIANDSAGSRYPPTMSKRILVAVAWPYASGSLHLGHLGGAYLPADIFARYHRIAGNEVLMVSGSDAHGTPITVKADEEGVTPREVVERYHPEILGYWDAIGISVDLFTTTLTENHARGHPGHLSPPCSRRAISSKVRRPSSSTPRPSVFSPTGMSKEPAPIADTPVPVATSARTAAARWTQPT